MEHIILPADRRLGRYELLIELGQGGMAELFLGRLHGAGGFEKLVAIKRILPHLARDEQFTTMFLEEGRIASRLSHPNVCQVFELDDADGELFLAMEYLDGVTWGQLLDALPLGAVAGPPLALAAGVLAQAADGLHYAHTLRDLEGKPTAVVHRDVSPQNLFVTIDGVCKVLDFGVSKMMTDGPRTRSGVVKGKLPYMAPEQILGEAVDARTDVFSLGICLWEALAGERLYDRATDFLIWKAVTEIDAPDITTRWPTCPPALASLLRRTLARDAAVRIPTARAFAEELRAATPVASTAAIADGLRAACGERITAREKQVATAISSRRSGPIVKPDAHVTTVLADGRRSSDELHSAAETLASGRSAALTLDDKPRIGDSTARHALEEAEPEPDPGATTDLRSDQRKAAEVRLRDNSMVVTRDSDKGMSGSLIDQQAIAAAKHSRLGLLIGALTGMLVIGVVIFIATRSPGGAAGASDPTPGPAPLIAGDASEIDAAALHSDGSSSTSSPSAASASNPSPAEATHVVTAPSRRPPIAPTPSAVAPVLPPVVTPVPTVPAAEGLFSVTSEPYATIYVDGQKLGDTPLFRAHLTAGNHTVRAVRADGREQTFNVDIQSGKERNRGKLAW